MNKEHLMFPETDVMVAGTAVILFPKTNFAVVKLSSIEEFVITELPVIQ